MIVAQRQAPQDSIRGRERPPTAEGNNRHTSWHALTCDETLRRLDAVAAGLGAPEAAARQLRYGPNSVRDAKPRPAWLRFLAQFHSVLLYVLIAAAVVTGLIGHGVDTAVILGVVVINAIIGFIQEDRAERQIDAIRDMLTPTARVLRDGEIKTINARDLVPGDIMALREGDRVGADARLIAADNVTANESILTGESLPTAKSTEPCGDKAAVGDRACIVHTGTIIASGRARAVVVKIGDQTELGKITASLTAAKAPDPPLVVHMAQFARALTGVLLAVSAAMVPIALYIRHMPLDEALLATVAFAVGAIPEGLPAILTITLAAGVHRMAARRAIIRRLPAVETLAAVTVIASDKTGTLTRNELAVSEWVTAHAVHAGDVRDGGYALAELARASLICTDIPPEDGPLTSGNPVDAAIIRSVAALRGPGSAEHAETQRISTLPFHSRHKFMAVLVPESPRGTTLYIKGAPEHILSLCRYHLTDNGPAPIAHGYWQALLDQLTDKSRRVIAVASVPWPNDGEKITAESVNALNNVTLVGLLSLSDPPRPDAASAIAAAKRAGIRVKLITGDHLGTARAISRELDLTQSPAIATGPQIEALDDEALKDLVAETDIFARTTPEHKLRLVRAIQASGTVMAMTGDGVNDAPALKAADIGIAMGQRGSEAAKQAAEMVLSDDNFSTIIAAVEEGRTVFDNVRKAIVYVLPTSIAEGLTILTAIVLGFTLPLTPLQVLWVNMVTAVALSVPLALEKPEADVMTRAPSDFAAGLLTRFVVWRVAFVSALLLGLILLQFNVAIAAGATTDVARALAVNTLVAGEIVYLFNVRNLASSSFTLGAFLGNRFALYGTFALVMLQAAFTHVPFMQRLFGTADLSPSQWGSVVLCGLAVFVLVELEKLAQRRLQRRAIATAGGLPHA